MDFLYAPWRSWYASKVNKKLDGDTSHQCPFCLQPKSDDDEKFFIVYRGKHVYVMMNLYPYNAGHMLVIPYNHKARLDELSIYESNEFMSIISKSVTAVQKALGAPAVNCGMNLGKEAGAGIPEHLHFHILPRFSGDTNFLPLIAQTKQISFDINEVFKKIKTVFSPSSPRLRRTKRQNF